MKLITKAQWQKLRANDKKLKENEMISIRDEKVVVKLFNPYGIGTWHIYSVDENDVCFGIATLHYTEYGDFSLQELIDLRVPPFNLPIERDRHYSPQTFREVEEQAKLVVYNPDHGIK